MHTLLVSSCDWVLPFHDIQSWDKTIADMWTRELGCGGKSHAFTDAKVDDLRPFGMDDVAKSYMCEEEWFEPPSGER